MARKETDQAIQARSEQGVARQEDLQWATPTVDVYENEREFLVMLDVPGVSAESVKLEFDRGELHFEAQGPVAEGALPDGVELGTVRYRRAFQLPDFIDASQLSAEMKDGTLSVHLPKQDAVRPRRIPVRAA